MEPNFNERETEQAAVLVRMAQLIVREKLGELDPAEKYELDQWLAETEEHRFWKNQLENPAFLAGIQEEFARSEQQMEASLSAFHRLHMPDRPVASQEAPVRSMDRRRQIRRWWAAAAVLIPLIAVGIWLAKKQDKSAQAPVLANIQPGGNKATLTLENGTSLALDTAASGHLMQPGGVQIHYDQGKVDYKPSRLNAAEISYNTLTTAKGGKYQLVLPDGSKVWLNAASSLRYPTTFTGKERHVELTGEAYFEVAQNKDKPFSVGVGSMNVRVLGTAFDIMAYPEEGRKLTTLIQGAVKVETGSEARLLAAGDQVAATEAGALTVSPDVNVEAVVAWKLGFFQFTDIDLKTMMREISRWYDVDIVYQRQELSGQFGGRISRNLNLTELISLLEGNGVGHFKIEGRRLIVLP